MGHAAPRPRGPGHRPPPPPRRGGWEKPVAPPPSWADRVRELFVHSDMEVCEFEPLLEVAMRGGRPEHPDLVPPRPAGLPLRVVRD